MEKFGIFDLLDTLSAIMAPDSPAPSEAAEEKTPPPSSAAGVINPKQTDGAFAPPSYLAGENGAAAVNAERAALGAFLDRHDAISRKIDSAKRD